MRIKCTLSYDGTNFSGFQIQPRARTVAGEIEKVLEKMHKGEQIRIHGSGRTDAGVHAEGQVIHFDTHLSTPLPNWKRALNTMLPEDINVNSVEAVRESFHARYDALAKEYHYYVQTEPERDVFKRNYTYHYPHTLDMQKIKQACMLLQGTHDFTSFSSAQSSARGSRIRTLYTLEVKAYAEGFYFVLYGDGFLYNMVRIIVGVLLDIGNGKKDPEDIPKLLEAKDRKQVGKTMPAQGLYLHRVVYE